MPSKSIIIGATLALFFIAALSVRSIGGGYEIRNFPNKGETIVAFGDSLVEGVGSSFGNDFISVLSGMINAPIINTGRSGDTTESARVRLSSDVLTHDPDIVIILLGGNDYLKRIPREETFANLEAIIRVVQEEGAVALLLGVQGGILGDSYDEYFERLAETMGAVYVENVLDGLIGNAELMADAIHPNDAGYRLIAEKVLPTLEDLLPR